MNKKFNLIEKTKVYLGVFVCALVISVSVNAQTPADTPCDPNYYDSLKSRAWLEAQREITQNQNLIFKPDSVLEYTCFDKYLNVLAETASDMFSENQDRWDKEVLPDDSMDTALESLVGTPVTQYINENFEAPGYDLLGGRIPVPPSTTGIDHVPEPVEGGDYACDIMNQVWMVAKCIDFASVPENDGFFTLLDYQTGEDKRFKPSACAAITDRWKAEYETALVDIPYAPDVARDPEGTPWKEDPLITYLHLVDPEECGSDIKPIETGLIIYRNQEPTEYKERVCLPPGCHYNPTGFEAGECVVGHSNE